MVVGATSSVSQGMERSAVKLEGWKSFFTTQIVPVGTQRHPERPPSSCRCARCARYAWELRCCTQAMHSSPPAIVDLRKGKMTSHMVRRCDTVRAGALLPHVQLQVPQKEMREHRQQHRVMPPGVFAHFIVVHPERSFACFTALRNGPTQATSPDQGASRRARGGIPDVGRKDRLRSHGALDHEPDGALQHAILAERHALASKRIHDRSLGPFRDSTPIPPGGRQTHRQGCSRTRDVGRGDLSPLGGHVPLLEVRLVLRLGALEPATRLRRARDTRRPPPHASTASRKSGLFP